MSNASTTGGPPDDLTEWRKAQRVALIDQRMVIPKETRIAWRLAIDRHIERGFPELACLPAKRAPAIVAICWPYRNEYDARHIAAKLRRAGAVTALPVVVAPREPLEFRQWQPGTPMARGPLGIPYPAQGEDVVPDALILPMAGFDNSGFRLGYGGGYFDRTLGSHKRRPLLIGVANEFARLPTIYPQLHDIPVDYVVTEAGLYQREGDLHGSRLAFLGAPAERAAPGFTPAAIPARESATSSDTRGN